MEIHKAKPVHGWRELLNEIGVIVIGVLIALAGEQVVEALHWRHQVGEAREALGKELAESVGQGIERVRWDPCVDHRLDEIEAIVDKAAENGRLPPVGEIGYPKFRTWDSGVWQSVLGSQTAGHFPSGEIAGLAITYQFIALSQRYNEREVEIWTKLYAIVGPGRKLEPGEVTSLRDAVRQARVTHRMIVMTGLRIDQMIKLLDFPIDADIVRGAAGGTGTPLSICQPLPKTAPPVYGTALMEGAVHSIEAAPLLRWDKNSR